MRLVLAPGDDMAAMVRGAQGESLVVVIPTTLEPVTLAMATAAIAPLAVERAPATRVNAVIAPPEHRTCELEAAIAFLESAASTTGQIVELS